jgi:MFS family permease
MFRMSEPARPDRTTQMARAPRLVTKPFLAVTAATGAFFIYVGMLIPLLPRFIEDELGAGELGVGLAIAAFAAAAIAARPMIARLIEARGRRQVMTAGALLAGAAGAVSGTVGSLVPLLLLRGVAGVGEAALFVGAATLISDLAPPRRRAEAASYFSVAVFGGLGIGPIIGEAVLGDGRFPLGFVVAAGFTVLAAAMSFAAPNRVLGQPSDGVQPPAKVRFLHPAAVGPGLVLAMGIAAFTSFSAFMPEHARAVGMGGSAGLFAAYSVVCLVLRMVGARVPERLGPRRSVSIAFTTNAIAFAALAVFAQQWALWLAAVVVGVGMAFQYPSLMALTINRADDHERAAALSSFTMFFEIGTVTGGLLLGTVANIFSKQAAFAASVLVLGFGLWLLRTKVLPAPTRHWVVTTGEVALVSVAGD